MKLIRTAAKNILKLFAPVITNDRWFVTAMYRLRTGRCIDIDHPQTYNEKLQWMKLYNRVPGQNMRVDKLSVKDIVAKEIGQKYVIPTLGVWNNPEDINFDLLPERFVLKVNHGWGGKCVFVCRDKSSFDRQNAVKKLKHWLHKDNYTKLCEWPYKGIKPVVMAEEYIGNDENPVPSDYKFFCFGGRAHFVMVCKGRDLGKKKPSYYYFDREWRFHPFNKVDKDLPSGFTLPRPENIDEMFHIADCLSRNEVHVRVDLYNVDGRIYFGEITYFNSSGYDNDITPETDSYFGSLIKLPEPSRSLK